MKNILVIGAGLSSSYLIKYLLEEAAKSDWHITVADAMLSLAEEKTAQHPNATAVSFRIENKEELEQYVSAADLVISMLPAIMHPMVAHCCITFKKHLVTASYISEDMRKLHVEALKANILFLNECGLDPGIDHMSALQAIDEIKHAGGQITIFKSYCGGLIAPEFDDNPWHYKFTWNPRNVVLAGQNTARYLENGELKFIPPSRIFSQTEQVIINSGEPFECYANRDSLEYIHPYGIENAHTVLRGTMRASGFCKGWNAVSKLGLNDDTFLVHCHQKLSYRNWLSAFTPGNKINSLEERITQFLNINEEDAVFHQLKWLGLFEDTLIPLEDATPAQILEHLLKQKWKLQSRELDRIVMHHVIGYKLDEKEYTKEISLEVKGENATLTAMAKTVGLPLGIAAKLILNGELSARGVQMPVLPEIYKPILKELETFDIRFH